MLHCVEITFIPSVRHFTKYIFIFATEFKIIKLSARLYREPGSSVSKVSAYGLDDRAIEVRSPAGATGLFL
jgi:hypothetical protein